MFRNYLKTALRNILKNRTFFLINISGLAIGLACVMVIISYVRMELSYDRFHENSENIFRVGLLWQDEGQTAKVAVNHAPLAPILKEQLPGVVHSTRIYRFPATISIDRQNKIKEPLFAFADSTFFEVFNFKGIYGDLDEALDHPGSLVLTESAAIRHFGSVNVIGEEVFYEDERRYTSLNVTAVIEDFPQNSHFRLDFLSNFSTLEGIMPWYDNWHHPPIYIYLETNGSHNLRELNKMVNEAVYDHLPDYVQAEKRHYFLQSLTDIHLYSNLEYEWEANSDITFVKLFVIIALFILIIASINFMNLATAQSVRRAREVGMRKVLGAKRKQLIWQFLSESFMTTLIALTVAFALAELVLIHAFNEIIERDLSILFMISWPYLGYVIVGLLLLSLFSGIYPSFYISAYRPLTVMKVERSSGRGLNIRRGLVTFQFFISSLLIIGTLIVLNQTSYLRNKQLGFEKDHIIALKMTDEYAQKNFHLLKEKLKSESAIRNAALSSALPGGDTFYGFEVYPEGIEEEKEYSLKTLGVDEDFFSTYDITILEGRGFDPDITTDQREAFVLNQAAIRKLNWEEPIGMEFGITVYTGKADTRMGKVIGVVEDFHFESLYEEVEPLVIYINKHPYYSDFLSVKFRSGNLSESVEILRTHWKEFNPDRPIEYYFLDQELDRMYHSEVRKSELFSAFAILSIFISCMGLFGLSVFTAQQKTKEVGIRKVMGASVASILKLLSKEYVILISIANVIAIPLAWYLAQSWLTNFAYRINISPWIFIISLVAGLLIALLTVSYQGIKAALINPVDSLRDE